MAWEAEGKDLSLLTVTDLSAAQYHFVKLSADNTVAICAQTTDKPIGILQNKPVGASGAAKAARVRVIGVSRLVAGGQLVAGNDIGTHSDGTGVAKSADKDIIMGQVLEGAASGGVATVAIYGAAYISKT